jgi:tRNA(fMet)-specific endonuclease VapC
MILLDTDHMSVLKYPESAACKVLTGRMEDSPDQDIGTTVVCLEEQMRGWLAEIARVHSVRRQIQPYQDLLDLLKFLSCWTILPFGERAANQFEQLRLGGVRIGAMDLKIASIALVHDGLLLSANRRHFEHVPGLRVENWLH